MMVTKQRLEHLDIWKMSIKFARHFCTITQKLEEMNMNKYSEYMNGTCLRLSNSIADLSSLSPKEAIARSLTNAHLLTLEAENIIMILYEQQLVETSEKDFLLKEIRTLDNMIIEYKKQSLEKHIFTNN